MKAINSRLSPAEIQVPLLTYLAQPRLLRRFLKLMTQLHNPPYSRQPDLTYFTNNIVYWVWNPSNFSLYTSTSSLLAALSPKKTSHLRGRCIFSRFKANLFISILDRLLADFSKIRTLFFLSLLYYCPFILWRVLPCRLSITHFLKNHAISHPPLGPYHLSSPVQSWSRQKIGDTSVFSMCYMICGCFKRFLIYIFLFRFCKSSFLSIWYQKVIIL